MKSKTLIGLVVVVVTLLMAALVASLRRHDPFLVLADLSNREVAEIRIVTIFSPPVRLHN